MASAWAGEDRATRAEVLRRLRESGQSPAAYAAAKEAIARLGAAAEPALISRLAAADAAERENAVRFLGLIRSERSVPYLLAKKRDAAHEVRIAAIEALWEMGDTNALEGIAASFLEDEHPSVRDVAVIVLGRYKDERAAPYLVKALGDTDAYARECARAGLEALTGLKMSGETEEEQNAGWKAWYEERLKNQRKGE